MDEERSWASEVAQGISERREAKAYEKRYGRKEQTYTTEWGWIDGWIYEKQNGAKAKRKNEETIWEEIWWSGGWLWGNHWHAIYWVFICLWVLFADKYLILPALAGDGQADNTTIAISSFLTILVAVLLVAFYIFLYSKTKGITHENTDDEEAILYRIFERAGALKEASQYSEWNVQYKGEQNEQARYYVVCREPGIDLFAIRQKIELEAPKIHTPSGRTIKDVFIQKRDSANYDFILDYRERTDDEIIDWFGQNNGLIPWEMPRTESGNLKGVFGFGAIDKGMQYGKPCTGFIYGHHIGVSGISGFGKSNMVHFLLYQLAQYNNIQIVYIDPQGTDGAFWVDRAIMVEGADKSLEALSTIWRIVDERRTIMKSRNWEKWQATPENPLLVVVVDEIKFLADEDKNIPKELTKLAAVARKFGISLIYATQYPKKEYVGGAWENLHYKVSSKTNSPTETQVVFGAKAPIAPCEDIREKGEFYITGPDMEVEHLRVPYCPTEWAKWMAQQTAKYKSNDLARRFGQGDTQFTPNEKNAYTYDEVKTVDDLFSDIWG